MHPSCESLAGNTHAASLLQSVGHQEVHTFNPACVCVPVNQCDSQHGGVYDTGLKCVSLYVLLACSSWCHRVVSTYGLT
jgi:hypothetical protein